MVSLVKMTFICNKLIGAIPLHGSSYYNYYLPTYFYDLNCTGVENNILNCPYNNSYHYCSRYQDAAVVCQCKYNYKTS